MFDVLRPHWRAEEIIDIVAVISLFGFLNRWNSVLGTGLEEMVATATSE